MMRPKSKSKPKKKIPSKSMKPPMKPSMKLPPMKLPPKHANTLASAQQLITSGNLLFDRKEILDKQQKLTDNYQKCKQNNPASITYYQKIKFQQQIYCCGDPVQFHALNQEEPFVGKLTKIIQLPKEKELLPFIEVEWYMHKEDLPEEWLQSQFYEHMGSAELFPSSQRLHLYVESLKCKCSVLTIDEYGELGIISDGIYFSRSSLEGHQLNPHPQTWRSDCKCKMPTNPQLKYISCNACERWFHEDCVMGGGQQGWECDQCIG